MKNNNKNNQEFDKAFNERFSDFHFNPDSDFFDRIQSKMESEEFDNEVKDRFDQFTITPSEKVWESVKPNLPLHLGIRIQLQRLSRVAAVLLFAMTGFYLYQVQQNHAMMAAATDVSIPSEEETILTENTDFVFEVPESVPVEEVDENKAKKKLRKKKKSKKKGVSDYLALILDEEDDFDEFIDHKKIRALLQPVEQLSPDFMSASALAPLPRYVSTPVVNNSQDIELNINIPLQVVEPHEVDDLIRLYDQTHQVERD